MSERTGYARLWLWFGLSRASFLTMPRVLMHEMSDEWQMKMAALLEEYDSTWVNWPDDLGTSVRITDGGKIIKTPDWITNYRHPYRDTIAALRNTPSTAEER